MSHVMFKIEEKAQRSSNPSWNPGSVPGSDPSFNPGSDPGSNPGLNPGSDPSSNPGSNPGFILSLSHLSLQFFRNS